MPSASSLTNTLSANSCWTFSLGIGQHSYTQLPQFGEKELCGDVCCVYIVIQYDQFQSGCTTIAAWPQESHGPTFGHN